eukprot:sb/3468286/
MKDINKGYDVNDNFTFNITINGTTEEKSFYLDVKKITGLVKGQDAIASKYFATRNRLKQPIRTSNLGHVTGYLPIRDRYILIRSVPGCNLFPKSSNKIRSLLLHALLHNNNVKDSYTFRPRRLGPKVQLQSSQARSVFTLSVPRRQNLPRPIGLGSLLLYLEHSGFGLGQDAIASKYFATRNRLKQPIRTSNLGHVTGYLPIRDRYILIRSVPGCKYVLFKTKKTFGDASASCKSLSEFWPISVVLRGTSKQPIRTRYLGHVTGY